MPRVTFTEELSDIHLWADPAEVEPEAMAQLRRVAGLPWVRRVSVMPDVHVGKGATVGSVIGTKDALAPAAVGVDIGCGMSAIKTNLTADDLPDSLASLRSEIEAAVPVGFACHAEPAFDPSAFGGLDSQAREVVSGFDRLFAATSTTKRKAERQLGTLGGGNHFIELCLENGSRCVPPGSGKDSHGRCSWCGGSGRFRSFEAPVWLVLHSGSRNAGKTLAEVHMERAAKLGHNEALKDPDLAVFLAGTPAMEAYRHDLYWAQEYAAVNRQIMLRLCTNVLRRSFPHLDVVDSVSCHHNYVAEERHFGEDLLVTRKGAIFAGAGAPGIIPGSMGTRTYIVEGRGNEYSMNSASHGAGRRMSRGRARRTFSEADLASQTRGVECRKDAGVLDEIPSAYKDIERVMEQQADLVRVTHVLKQVMCIKG